MSSFIPRRRKFPFQINIIESNLNTELLKYFLGEKTGFVQVGPEKYFFPYKYMHEAEAYYNFQARADDIWIVTFPRSGTTWTQEMVWLLANDLNFELAKTKLLTERFPFFEFSLFIHPQIKNELLHENHNDRCKLEFIEKLSLPGYETLNNMSNSSKRFIKTHFPFSLLPPSVMEKKCKVIYVARDPKDVAISYYYLNRLYRTQGFIGDFKQYWTYFENGLNPWMPYFSHLREAMEVRHLPNVLFLKYENMLDNLSDVVEQVANFLGYELNAEGMENLLNHLNISNFRVNPSVNGHEMEEAGLLNKDEASFIRRGVNGSQEEFAKYPELEARADKWWEEFAKYPELEARADKWVKEHLIN